MIQIISVLTLLSSPLFTKSPGQTDYDSQLFLSFLVSQSVHLSVCLSMSHSVQATVSPSDRSAAYRAGAFYLSVFARFCALGLIQLFFPWIRGDIHFLFYIFSC